MSEKISVSKGLKIKWKGPFDMTELYKTIKYWLDFNGYGDEKKSFREEKYVERIKGEAKQVEIKWSGEKEISKYFSYVIEITYFIIGLKKTKITKDGKEYETDKADLELRLSASIITDKKNKFKDKELLKKFYDKFIIKDRIEGKKIELYQKIYSLHDEIKGFLELHKY
jgi:hypothetical protein